MTLLWRKDVPPLGESCPQALQRYRANERSIIKKGTWKAFQAVVQEYLDLVHAQPVPAKTLSSSIESFYLPMHSVWKESSTSTKLHVVFDASAKSLSGTSLNDSMLVGPMLHPTLEPILLRFRSYPVALTGDISKMFWVVELSRPDRSLHRFLWRTNPEDSVTDYEMLRVTFRVAASPYLAVKCLQQTAQDFGAAFPRASLHVQSTFYVDDCLAGASTPQEVLGLFTKLRKLLLKGGFSLCKIRSSGYAVTQSIESSLREKLPVKGLTDLHSSPHPKALGLEWDSQSDTMSMSLLSPFQPNVG